MQYAIETLEIEAAKCKDALRVVDKYSAFPEYSNSGLQYLEHLREIEKAIAILKESVGSVV